MKPSKYDTEIVRGSTFRRVFQLKQSDGTPMDLSGYVARSQMRKTYDSTAFIDLNAIIDDALLGKVSIFLAPATTKTIGYTTAVYDLEIELAGEITQVIFGNIVVRPEATRE